MISPLPHPDLANLRLCFGKSIGSIKKEIVQHLVEFGIEEQEARVESEMMIEHVSELKPSRQLIDADLNLTDAQLHLIDEFLSGRRRREPIQYLLGETFFMGLKFKMRRGVFIPRADTETLVEVALRELKKRGEPQIANKQSGRLRILEIGVGSGAICVSILRNLIDVELYGVDVNHGAIELTRENATAHGVLERLHLMESSTWCRFQHADGNANSTGAITSAVSQLLCSWTQDIEGAEPASHTKADRRRRFNAVLSNPPYIPSAQAPTLQMEVKMHEPAEALYGWGEDGLGFYRDLCGQLERLLEPDGSLVAVEVGDGQAEAVSKMFEGAGLKGVSVQADLKKLPRVVFGRWFA